MILIDLHKLCVHGQIANTSQDADADEVKHRNGARVHEDLGQSYISDVVVEDDSQGALEQEINTAHELADVDIGCTPAQLRALLVWIELRAAVNLCIKRRRAEPNKHVQKHVSRQS